MKPWEATNAILHDDRLQPWMERTGPHWDSDGVRRAAFRMNRGESDNFGGDQTAAILYALAAILAQLERHP